MCLPFYVKVPLSHSAFSSKEDWEKCANVQMQKNVFRLSYCKSLLKCWVLVNDTCVLVTKQMQYQCDHYTNTLEKRFRAGSTKRLPDFCSKKKKPMRIVTKKKKSLILRLHVVSKKKKKKGGPLIQTKLWKKHHFTLCLLTHSSRITCSVASSQAAILSSASAYQQRSVALPMISVSPATDLCGLRWTHILSWSSFFHQFCLPPPLLLSNQWLHHLTPHYELQGLH